MRITIVAAAVAALVAGSAHAESSFNNHLRSNMMVSPAQIYQIEDLKTDFQLGYSNSGSEFGDDTTITTTGTNLFAAGVYDVDTLGLTAGLSVDYTTGESTLEFGDVESTGDASNFTLTPQAAYQFGPVVAGLAFDVVQAASTPEDGDESTSTHIRSRPGVLFAQDGIEAGLTYWSPNNIKANAEDNELAVTEAAVVKIHGRYALSKELAVGGIFTNEAWSGINEDAFNDKRSLTATGEFVMDAIKVEGDLTYNGLYYKTDSVLAGDMTTMETIELAGAADYSLNKNTTIGGALSYEFGSDEVTVAPDTTEDVSMSEFALAIRGNMTF